MIEKQGMYVVFKNSDVYIFQMKIQFYFDSEKKNECLHTVNKKFLQGLQGKVGTKYGLKYKSYIFKSKNNLAFYVLLFLYVSCATSLNLDKFRNFIKYVGIIGVP